MKRTASTTTLNRSRGLRNWTLAAALLALMPIAGIVQAQVTNLIYQDTFARSGLLNGSMPDTANATGAKYIAGPLVYTGTWTDQNGNTEKACYFSNSIPAVLGPIFNEAFLPITVQTGHVYTLSASFLVNTNYNGFYMFLAYDTCPSLQIISNDWYAGMILRSTNNPFATGNLQTFAGVNQASPATYNITPSGTPWNPQFITLTSVLNLTNPAAITEYWFTNGVPIRTNNVGGNIAGGNNGMWPRYIVFGQSSSAGYVTNLTFTDVVPYPSVPTILEQPNDLSAPQGQTATFWVNAAGAPDPAYQWMTNNGSDWVNIPGATNATYTTPPLSSAYNGLTYQVVLTNAAGSQTSSPAATLTVTAANPTVFSATKTASPTSIVVNFSGAVDPATSLTAANYTLNNGASVSSVSAGSVPSSVVLTTSALAPGGAYNLAVKNVQDLFGDVMAASTNVVLPAGLVLDLRADSGVQLDAGGASVAQWLDQTTNGNHASQFFGWKQSTSGIFRPSTSTRPTTGNTLNGLPAITFNASAVTFLQVASTPSVAIDTNLTVYVVAQVTDTAQNRHFISKCVGNIPASFELDAARPSANGPVQPDLINGSAGSGNSSVLGGSGLVSAAHVFAATRALQAIFTNAWVGGPFPPAQTNWFYTASNNATVYLDGIATASAALNSAAPGWRDGGEPVFIGTRQDHFSGDIMNGQIAEILLFNAALSATDRTNVDNYLGLKYFPFTITSDLPPSITTSNGYQVTFTFGANQGSAHLTYQWQKSGTNIAGATNPTYTTPPLLTSDNGDTFDVLVTTTTGSTAYSTTNTLTVLNVAPFITSVGIPIWNMSQVVVIFDKTLDPASATNKANYSLDHSASILSAAMGDAANKVVLTTSALTWNANPGFYTLTASHVKDITGNPMATTSQGLGLYPPATALWVRGDTGVTTDAGTNTVAQWNDLSGNGNHLYSSPLPEPVLVTNAQGDTVVRFSAADGTIQYANDSPSLEITGDMSIIALVNFATLDGGTNGEIVSKTGLGGGHANIPAPYDYYIPATNNGAHLYRGNGTTYGQSTAASAPSTGTPHVLVATDVGNTVSHFLDGAAGGVSILNNGFNESDCLDAGQPLYLGERADGLLRLTGDLSELIVAGSAISSGDVAALQTYLTAQHHLVNTTPTNMTVRAANNQLTFSWPTDHLGWGLQSNSVSLTATGSWFAVPGASATNQIVLPIDPVKTNIFYRMIYPPQ